MKTGSLSPGAEIPIATPAGQFVARYSDQGLMGLDFPKVGSARCADRTPQRGVPTIPAQIRRWHRATATALKLALLGSKPKTLPPLDLSAGTAFQQSVWRVLRRIPRGRTKSYGEIAHTLGKPKASRAVGGACGANPIPVLVPCHRVLAANRKLGGFSAGLKWKRKLLAREGIQFR